MKDIIGISFDTDDMDDDNAFLMMVLKEIDTNLEWKADCFTDYEDYLNSEIEGYLSIKELEKVLNESKKAIFIRIMGKTKPENRKALKQEAISLPAIMKCACFAVIPPIMKSIQNKKKLYSR